MAPCTCCKSARTQACNVSPAPWDTPLPQRGESAARAGCAVPVTSVSAATNVTAAVEINSLESRGHFRMPIRPFDRKHHCLNPSLAARAQLQSCQIGTTAGDRTRQFFRQKEPAAFLPVDLPAPARALSRRQAIRARDRGLVPVSGVGWRVAGAEAGWWRMPAAEAGPF